jgi:hypothetical protein
MRNLLGLPVMWVAELLDRSLLPVPDVDVTTPSEHRIGCAAASVQTALEPSNHPRKAQ